MRPGYLPLVWLVALCFFAEPALAVEHPVALALSTAPCKSYRDPPGSELTQARKLFLVMLSNTPYPPQLAGQWRALGFDWLPLEWAGQEAVMLKEQADRCEGRGLFLFRNASAERSVLQMPHRFYDEATGQIGYRLMQRGQFRAAAWNTVPRYSEGALTGGSKADLAHNGQNFFTALAEAAAMISTRSHIVQVHGFDADKRRSDAGRDSVAIVSDGSARPSRTVRELAACLGRSLEGPVRLYPRDVDELGGTTNHVGSALRNYAHQGFVHLELSAHLRSELLSRDSAVTDLTTCLAGAMN